MSRIVFCRKYQKELPGLDAPPFPGPKGTEIFETVSSQAWQEWLSLQTMLINEKHLNLMDLTARNYLNDQREKFLAGAEVDQVEGYIPPDK